MNENIINAMDLNQQASLLMQTGNYEEAKKLLDKAVTEAPMCAESYKNLGLYHMAKENYEEAKNEWKRALLIDKKDGEAYYNLGNAHFLLDELSEGIDCYNRAVSAGFDTARMQFLLGIAYEEQGNLSMALRHFSKAAGMDPTIPDYMVKKSMLQIKMNLWEDALTTAEELIFSSPEQFEGYHMKTQILLHDNKLQEAESFAQQASRRFPGDAGLLFDWVKVVVLQGNYQKAFEMIQQAKQMKYFADAKRDFCMLESNLYAERGEFDRAIEIVNEVIAEEQENAPDIEARHQAITLYYVSKKFQEAHELANTIVCMDKKDMYYRSALYYSARTLLEMGKKEEAKKIYKDAITAYRMITINEPDAIDAYLFRAMALKDIDEDNKALEMIDFILNLTNEIAEPFVIKAEIYKKQGRIEDAQKELEKAYFIKPALRIGE